MADSRKKIQIRFTDDELEQLKYWAAKDGVSVNEWVEDAISQAIAIKNGDYRLPTLLDNRLNQIIDGFASLATNVENLSDITVSNFASLLGLVRGDNYLLEEDNHV